MNQKIYNFYKGFPNYGEYVNKLNEIRNLLYSYLINFKINNNNNNYKKTVIFDIDDTLVFTDPVKIINDNTFPNNFLKGYMIFPPINQIIFICKLCKKLNFKIIIITARPYESEKSSIKNLKLLGIEYDEIFHNKFYPNNNFKIPLKQELSKKNNIILSVGDQFPDLIGLKDCLCIKLPCPDDTNAYFTYDNINYYKI